MTVLTAEEVEKRFGYTLEQLDKMEADATAGVFHGEPSGPVVYAPGYGPGRPLMFDEEMKQVGFKEPVNKILLIDIRAAQLGMKRSEYLRHLVDEDLKLAGIA